MAARIRSAGGAAAGTEAGVAAEAAAGAAGAETVGGWPAEGFAAGRATAMQAIRILIHPICELIGWRRGEL